MRTTTTIERKCATELLKEKLTTTDAQINQLLQNIKIFQKAAENGTNHYGWAGSIAHINNQLSEINEFLNSNG